MRRIIFILYAALGFVACGDSPDTNSPSDPGAGTTGGADSDGYVIVQAANVGIGKVGVTLFDPRTGERAGRHWEVSNIAASPRGDLVAGSTADGGVEIMRVGQLTLEPVQTIRLPVETGPLVLGFNTIGDRVFGASGDIVFWADLTGAHLTWCVPSEGNDYIRPSPDGRHYVLGCRSDGAGTAATGLYDDFELAFEGPRYFSAGTLPDRVQFSPDGQWLVVRHPIPFEGVNGQAVGEALFHRSISLLHVPSRTFMPGGLEGEALAQQQPWFTGPFFAIHPTNRLAALTMGGRGDFGLTEKVDYPAQDPRYIDLAGTMSQGEPDVAFEVGLGPPYAIGEPGVDQKTLWHHLGFSADGRAMFTQFVQVVTVTVGTSTDPGTGVTTAVQQATVVGSTIRRAPMNAASGPDLHDFGSEESCGPAFTSVGVGTARLAVFAANAGYGSTAPWLLALRGGAVACFAEAGWSVIDGDAFTLEDFGDVWSPDRRWADMTNGENNQDLCFRNIDDRETIDVVCPNGPFGTPHAPSIAVAWPSGGHVRPGLEPTVTGISRVAASPGDEVHVFGVRFGESGTLTIGDEAIAAAAITAWTTDRVTFEMPADAPATGRVLVTTGDGSDRGAAAFHLTRTERWTPPFSAPDAPDVVQPGAVEIQVTPPDAIDEIRLGAAIAAELPGFGQAWFPTVSGAVLYVSLVPDLAARWVYAQAGHLVRTTPVTVSREFTIQQGQWTPLVTDPLATAKVGIDSGGDFHRLGERTFLTTERVGLSDEFVGFEQGIEGSTTCTICENPFRLPRIVSDGLGRAVGFHRSATQEFGGWEVIPEGRTGLLWEPAVATPDLGGTIEALGVSPDALVMVGSDGVTRVAHASTDGVTYEPLATLGDDPIRALHYASGAPSPGWFVVGQNTLSFLSLTGDVEPLPAPRDGGATEGRPHGKGMYVFSKPTKQLSRLDAAAAIPAWETVTEQGLEGQVLSYTVDPENDLAYALRADGAVFIASDSTVGRFQPWADPIRYPGQAADFSAGLILPLGEQKVGVLVPPPSESFQRAIWFVRQFP